MKYDLTGFYHGLDALRLSLSDAQMQQFLVYYERMIAWNREVNLTRITDFNEVVTLHFLDSLCLVRAFSPIGNEKILDLGTGAGFPGIPLKIAFPELEMVLMDSLNKRVIFLNEMIDVLGLTGITAVHGRAEEMARDDRYRQSFDLCVSRAVSNLSTLSEYCLPFVKIGGRFVSYKSAEIEAELQEAKKAIFLLGGTLEKVEKFQLPESESKRSLVCIKKEKGTPKTYPRRAGLPAKKPI